MSTVIGSPFVGSGLAIPLIYRLNRRKLNPITRLGTSMTWDKKSR